MVPDTGSLPDAALATPAHRWQVQPRQLPDLADVRSWPYWIDLAWLLLWLLGLVCIVLFGRWEAIPFHLIWISFALLYSVVWVLMWHGRRRHAAGAENQRIGAENQRLLATQRQFLQDASHQLRTPITIALGHAELLARNLADGQDKRDIDVVVGELNRLRKLSERLLLIAASANPDSSCPSRWHSTSSPPRCSGAGAMQPTARWQFGRLDHVTRAR